METQEKANSAASLPPTTIDPDIEELSEDVAQMTLPPSLDTAEALEDIDDDNIYKFARTFGVGNSAILLKKSSLVSSLTKYVRLLPARFFPFCPPYDDENLIQFAYAAGYVRCTAADMNDEDVILAITIGECFSPDLPDSKFETLEKSREAIRRDVQEALTRGLGYSDVSFDARDYIDFCDNWNIGKHFPDAKDYSSIAFSTPYEEIRLTTFQTAMKLLYYLSRSIDFVYNIEPYVVVHAYCAMAKRGFVTREFCRKISETMKKELKIPKELNARVIRIAYNSYMKDCNIPEVKYLELLLSQIPDYAVKLRAMLKQAQNIHLTIFILIGNAIKKFPYFHWLRLNEVAQGELQKWAGISKSFELKKDFPFTVISNHSGEQINTAQYMSVAYVAVMLLIKIGGETALQSYIDIFSDIRNKNTLDTLILEYCAPKNIGAKSNSFLPTWYKTMLSSLNHSIFLD